MNRMGALVGGVLVALCAGGAEIRWQGSATSVSWAEPSVWEGGIVPTEDDVVVFDPGAGVTTNILLEGTRNVAGVKFLSGTFNFGDSSKKNSHYLYMKGDSGDGNRTYLYVAEGATPVMGAGPAPYHKDKTVLVKTGAGTLTLPGNLGASKESFALVDVAGGTLYVSSGTFYSTNYIVRTGATWSWGTYNQMVGLYPYAYVEEGGTISFKGQNENDSFRGIEGFGKVCSSYGGKIHLTLKGGPYRFGGKFGNYNESGGKGCYVIFDKQDALSDEEYRFILASTNALGGCSAVEFGSEAETREVKNNPIRFAPGIGRFNFRALGCKKDAPLHLEDLDGEPVEIYVTCMGVAGNNTFPSFPYLGVTGSGSLYMTCENKAYQYMRPFTNDCIRLTGAIGAASTGVVQFGDGTSGKDADLSTVGKVVAKGSDSKVTFANSGALDLAKPIVNAGTVTFAGPGTATVHGPLSGSGKFSSAVSVLYADTRTESGNKPSYESTAGTATLAAAGGTAYADSFCGSGTFLVTNGFFCSGFAANRDTEGNWTSCYDVWAPLGVSLAASHVTIGAGAEVRVKGGSSSFYDVAIGPGGVLDQIDASYTAGRLTLDGGEYRMSSDFSLYYAANFPSGLEKVSSVKVTARGGAIRHVSNYVHGYVYARAGLAANFSAASSDETPGELVIASPGKLFVNQPIATGGPVRMDYGYVSFNTSLAAAKTAYANGLFFGTGDLVLGGVVFDLNDASTDYGLKLAASGQKLRLAGASLILGRLAGTASQTVTFGDGTSSPFVREKGAFLALGDIQPSTFSLDGTGPKFSVSGAKLSVDATTGILKDPIFGYTRNSAASTLDGFCRFGFLTQTAEGLLKEDTSVYAEGVEGGLAKVARVSAANTNLAVDAQVPALLLDACGVSIAEGKTLKVGTDDTDHPAVVLARLSTGVLADFHNAYVSGAGTLDFGASEGLVVVTRASQLNDPISLSARIAGTGGLSVGGVAPWTYGGSLALGGDNTYTGGTRVNGVTLTLNSPTALSTGPVTIRSEDYSGGRVRFRAAGTLANEWLVGGVGAFMVGTFGVEPGCLVFNADVTLTGAVRVDRMARFSTSTHEHGSDAGPDNSGTGVFAGEISGGRVEINASTVAGHARKPIVFAHANSYTGGTFVSSQELVLRGAGTLGTGKVTLANAGCLTVENAAEKTVPNGLTGKGYVKLAGSAPVHFTGDIEKTSWCSVMLDLAGTAPVFAEAPPFAVVTNRSDKAVKATLKGDMTLDPANYASFGPRIRLVLDGGTVDLNGGTLTVERVESVNGGRVANGTVVETKPKKGFALYLR